MMYNIGNQKEEITYENPNEVQLQLYAGRWQVGHKREAKRKSSTIKVTLTQTTNEILTLYSNPMQTLEI